MQVDHSRILCCSPLKLQPRDLFKASSDASRCEDTRQDGIVEGKPYFECLEGCLGHVWKRFQCLLLEGTLGRPRKWHIRGILFYPQPPGLLRCGIFVTPSAITGIHAWHPGLIQKHSILSCGIVSKLSMR